MPKRVFIIAISLFIAFSCKKKETHDFTPEITGGKKYAKYRIQITHSPDLKQWLATLEKAEEVTLLEEVKTKDPKGNEVVISKVRLSDDKEGYVASIHLGNEPLVFLQETKAYTRPSPLVKVQAEIPEGSIGFTMEQKDGWSQVYVGKIGDTWVNGHWVEDGSYSKDLNLLIDAKNYENAMNLLKEKKDKDARKILEDLIESGLTEKFRNLASNALSPRETKENPSETLTEPSE